MASSSFKRSHEDNLELPPEKARKMFENGGVLIVLGLPVGSVFGIDMKVYQVGDKFQGLKMIPPGLHFIYYSAVSKEGSIAPRTGFFHYFAQQEIVIKKWDASSEDLNSVEPSGDDKRRIRENLQEMDRYLGPYPYQHLKQWSRLTCNISESLVKRLQPLSGSVSSVTQLLPSQYPSKDSLEPDSTSDKRFQTLEERFLPDMKVVPGTEIRFTAIPKNKYPEGCSASQITMYNMDSTFRLDQILKCYENEEDILGELQMAHICFLVAHVYDSFEHWKNLVQVLCSVDSGLEKHSSLLTTFLTIFHYQLKEIPNDFFVDITSDNNFLVNTLQIFFENVKNSSASEQFKNFSNNFRKNLTATYKWDFEEVPEDELPVIVDC